MGHTWSMEQRTAAGMRGLSRTPQTRYLRGRNARCQQAPYRLVFLTKKKSQIQADHRPRILRSPHVRIQAANANETPSAPPRTVPTFSHFPRSLHLGRYFTLLTPGSTTALHVEQTSMNGARNYVGARRTPPSPGECDKQIARLACSPSSMRREGLTRRFSTD